MAIIRAQMRYQPLGNAIRLKGNVRRIPHTPDTIQLLQGVNPREGSVRRLTREARPHRESFECTLPLTQSFHDEVTELTGGTLQLITGDSSNRVLTALFNMREANATGDPISASFVLFYSNGRPDRTTRRNTAPRPRRPRSTAPRQPRLSKLAAAAQSFRDYIDTYTPGSNLDRRLMTYTACPHITVQREGTRRRVDDRTFAFHCHNAQRAAWSLAAGEALRPEQFDRRLIRTVYGPKWIQERLSKARGRRKLWYQRRITDLAMKDPDITRGRALAEARERATGVSLPNVLSASAWQSQVAYLDLRNTMATLRPHRMNPMSNDPQFLHLVTAMDYAQTFMEIVPRRPHYYGSQRKPRHRAKMLSFGFDIAVRARRLSGMGMNMLLSAGMIDPMLIESLQHHMAILHGTHTMHQWKSTPRFPHCMFLDGFQ